MGIEKLIPWAISIVFMAAFSGQLPRFTQNMRLETLKLLKASQSSSWGNVWIPETTHSPKSR